jgi:hypothetical protein
VVPRTRTQALSIVLSINSAETPKTACTQWTTPQVVKDPMDDAGLTGLHGPGLQ